ncbi:MAG: hypothetical protein KBC88_00260 [Alphaproteobacteria bacterium]|jgi:hypothetical protein|nr:hypothetical protein [Alphaproteobacteria bacterium]
MGNPTTYKVTDTASHGLARLLATSFAGPGVVTSDFRAASRDRSAERGPEISAPK